MPCRELIKKKNSKLPAFGIREYTPKLLCIIFFFPNPAKHATECHGMSYNAKVIQRRTIV